MAEKKEEQLSKALLKVALGYQIAEVTEEYADVNGELKLTKRKKTKKDVPPDLKAVQILLSGESGDEYATWTDERLEEEKRRLTEQLALAESERKKTATKTAKKAVKTTKTTKKRTVKKK